MSGEAGTPYISNAYQYDMWNEMTQAVVTDDQNDSTTVVNAYNGEGLRTVKAVDGNETYYLLENSKIILELDGQGNQTARNVYGINLIAGTYNNQVLYYLYNGHADVTGIVDSAGTIQAGYYYDSYGVILESTGNVNNSITYAGYTFDAETGLYYLNSRMYNPNTARFMQEDTYNGEASSPLSLNIYVYCTNNPLTYYDPNGNMGLIQALDLILFAYIDSLVAWTPEEFMANFRKDTYIPDRLTFAFEAASAYINEYKQEAAVIAVSYGLIIGGSLVLPSNAAIGSGMINAGISVGMKGLSDYWEHGKVTYSAMEYTKTGMAGFASGTITGGIAKYGISIGLSGIKNSVFASFGGMSGFAAAQLIMTGNVDPKEMIVSGIISFVCAGGIRDLVKLATPKSVTVPVSKVKGFFADEKGELSSGKPGASGFEDEVGGTDKSFDSFNAYKKEFGPAGEGKAWHHIVEQNQIQKSGFANTQIHNTKNVIAIDSATHAKISGYYNSIDPRLSDTLRVRNWLKGQSFEFQNQFGINTLKDFGVMPR